MIEALRKFVDTVDPKPLPDYGEGPAQATEILNSAMEMSD